MTLVTFFADNYGYFWAAFVIFLVITFYAASSMSRDEMLNYARGIMGPTMMFGGLTSVFLLAAAFGTLADIIIAIAAT